MAAGRALLVEVQSNYDGTQSLSTDLSNAVPKQWPDFTVGRYYAKTVWHDTLPLVAPLLKWNELATVANAYRLFEIALKEIERAGQGLEQGSHVGNWEQFRRALQEIRNHSLATTLYEFNAARKLLASKVLETSERELMLRQL